LFGESYKKTKKSDDKFSRLNNTTVCDTAVLLTDGQRDRTPCSVG